MRGIGAKWVGSHKLMYVTFGSSFLNNATLRKIQVVLLGKCVELGVTLSEVPSIWGSS